MKKNTDSLLRVEKKGLIACLTLHCPEKRNALTPELLTELHMNLERFSKHEDTRCVVIRGSGEKMFSSGYDIAAIPVGREPEERQETPEVLLKALEAVKNFPYPVIAMLNGHAFGAGFNLCACCDIRIAAEDVKMGMTPARLGVAYHPDGILQFIEAFGIARTKEIFYTAQTFQGQDLLQKGLVNHLIPRANLEAFTLAYADNIARNAPLSLKAIKTTMGLFEKNRALGPADLEAADQWIQKCFQSNDLKEGRAAFLEKRTPEFTGT